MKKFFEYLLKETGNTQYEAARKAKYLKETGLPDTRKMSQIVNRTKYANAQQIVEICKAVGATPDQVWKCLVKSANYMRREK